MIIKASRTRLDQVINNKKNTVLLLSGSTNSKAGAVHTAAVPIFKEPWRKCILLTDLSILTQPEKTRWFGGAKVDCYAVIGGSNIPKKVGQKGDIGELLRMNGQPARLVVKSTIAKGDTL